MRIKGDVMRRIVLVFPLALLLSLGLLAEGFGQVTSSSGYGGVSGSSIYGMGSSGISGLSGLGGASGLGGMSGLGGFGSGMGTGSSGGIGSNATQFQFLQMAPKFSSRRAGDFVGSDLNDLPSVFGGAITDSGSTVRGGTSGGSRLGGTGSSSGLFGSSYGGRSGSSYGGLGSSYSSSGSSYGGRTGSSYGGYGSSSYGGYGSSYGGRSGSSQGGYGSSYGGYGSSYGSRSGSTSGGYGGYGSSTGRIGSSLAYGSSLGTARGSTMGRYGTTGLGSTGTNQLAVSINLSFPFQPRTQETVSRSLTAVLTKRGRLSALSPVAVSVREGASIHEGNTAVLRGVVATQHDRDLAEELVRLEPGVGQVDNLLTVGQPAASPASPTPASP
jgi:hypothetical protein